jgi:23S rRNA pseudouridine1911/1915/1917 synthase
MKYIHHPIIGDSQYGGIQEIGNKMYKRQMLHSYQLIFIHPSTKKKMNIISQLPIDIKSLLELND